MKKRGYNIAVFSAETGMILKDIFFIYQTVAAEDGWRGGGGANS